MPFKKREPVEKYTERKVVYFTPEQLHDAETSATNAGLELGPYIREATLGLKTLRRAKPLTIDGQRFTMIMGALGNFGELAYRILDALEERDSPLIDEFREAVSEMLRASETLLKALEGQ